MIDKTLARIIMIILLIIGVTFIFIFGSWQLLVGIFFYNWSQDLGHRLE